MPDELWFDEVDLDPQGAWLRMGTRNLGRRPWLVADRKRSAELALKQHLLGTRREDVFAVADDARGPAQQTLDLIVAELNRMKLGHVEDNPVVGAVGDPGRHPLDQAGRLVQEDLCLLRPVEGRWVLAGASLCFPSRWRLADKFEQSLPLVHGPVTGYQESLSDRVDNLLNRLGSKIVWRRNWFIHPNPTLFQPQRPADGDRVVPADQCLDQLYLRSERQTLRRLEPSGWALFTIRTQQASLRAFGANPDRRRRLTEFVTNAEPSLIGHKGAGGPQRGELLAALSAHSSS